MIKIKIFRDRESYFQFINEMKDIVNIISVRVLKSSIKIEYEKCE